MLSLLCLALGNFALGTGAFVIAGVLPQIGGDLGAAQRGERRRASVAAGPNVVGWFSHSIQSSRWVRSRRS